MLNCVKRYTNFPFAHRQPNHKGHCSLIHGHNWSFEFEFEAMSLDENGFVVDFGSLGWLKEWLADHFDHTLVLNKDDALYDLFAGKLKGAAKIVSVPNCGAEGLAQFILNEVSHLVLEPYQLRVRLVRVSVFEDDRNSAVYRP